MGYIGIDDQLDAMDEGKQGLRMTAEFLAE